MVPPTQTPNRQCADISCEVLNIQELQVKGYYTHNVCIIFVQPNRFASNASGFWKASLRVLKHSQSCSFELKKTKPLPFTDNMY